MMNLRRFLIIVFLAFVGIASSFADKKKKNTPEYEAQLAATMVAIDSIMDGHELNEPIEDFCDKVIKKFDKEPRLEMHIAEQFSRSKLQSHDIAYSRMEKLIKKYPKFMDGYLTYAQLLVERSVRMQHNDSLASVSRARQVVDSCKTVLPDSIEPYMKWVRMFLKRDFKEVDNEAEAVYKKFPNFPVYSQVATYYFQQYDLETNDTTVLNRSLSYLRKQDKNSMTLRNIVLYTIILNLVHDYEPGLDLVNYGLEKFPNSRELHRYALRFNVELGKREKQKKNSDMAKLYYGDAIAASEKLFGVVDTMKYEPADYRYSGNAYQGMNQFTKAISMYRQEMATKGESDKEYEIAIKNISSCYDAIYPDSAILVYEEYIDYKKKHGKAVEASDYWNLAEKCRIYSDELMANEKIDMLHKADSLYMMILTVDSTENNVSLAYARHMQMIINLEKVEFGESKWGDAVFEAASLQANYIESLQNSGFELTNAFKLRLCQAYYNLAIAYFYNTQKISDQESWFKALSYSEKLLQLEASSGYEGVILRSIVAKIEGNSSGRMKKRAAEIKAAYIDLLNS